MSFKESLRRWKDRSLLLTILYEHIYLCAEDKVQCENKRLW